MIFIDKQQIAPDAFLRAVSGLASYDDLQGANKQTVIDLLLDEQGGLCPLCERSRFGPTLEHYLPRSENPLLQLDYHNLYVCCQPCNGPKAHHLIPPYIFDRRFDPCLAQHPLHQNNGVYQLFEVSADDHCYLKVPASVFPSSAPIKPEHWAGSMLHSTIELTEQNRTGPEHANLVLARGKEAAKIRTLFRSFSDFQILEAWDRITTARSRPGYRFPAFVSLHLQELSRVRTARGI